MMANAMLPHNVDPNGCSSILQPSVEVSSSDSLCNTSSSCGNHTTIPMDVDETKQYHTTIHDGNSLPKFSAADNIMIMEEAMTTTTKESSQQQIVPTNHNENDDYPYHHHHDDPQQMNNNNNKKQRTSYYSSSLDSEGSLLRFAEEVGNFSPPPPPTRTSIAQTPPPPSAMKSSSSFMSSSSNGQLTTRKSVDFAILPPSPSKRSFLWRKNDSSTKEDMSSMVPNNEEGDSPGFIEQYSNIEIDSSSTNNNPNNTYSSNNNLYTIYANNNNNNNNGCNNNIDNCWNARQVVDAISTCICPNERIEAIVNAMESLNHNNQELHNEEMSTGIDSAMTKHLTFLVYQYNLLTIQMQKKTLQPSKPQSIIDGIEKGNSSTTTTTCFTNHETITTTTKRRQELKKEISYTLNAMELLYRASSQIVGVSFERMGKELLQLITTILQDEIQYRMDRIHQNNNNNRSNPTAVLLAAVVEDEEEDGDRILIKGTKLVAHLARAVHATKTIATFPFLLPTVLQLIQIHPYECIPWESRLSVLWTIANLACNPENMSYMVSTTMVPHLVPALIAVANRSSPTTTTTTPSSSFDETTTGTIPSSVPSLEWTMEILRTRSIVSRIVLNLSWLPENRIVLSNQSNLIDLLCQLTCTRTVSMALSSHTTTRTSGTGETNPFSSSLSSSSRPRTYHHHQPQQQCHHHHHHPYNKSKTIQEILRTTRQHSSGALRNIATVPRKYKVQLCRYNHGQLLDAITESALNDPDNAVQERVYGTIHNLANQDTADMIVNHPALVLVLKNALSTSSSATTTTTSLLNDNNDDSGNTWLNENDLTSMDNLFGFATTTTTTTVEDNNTNNDKKEKIPSLLLPTTTTTTDSHQLLADMMRKNYVTPKQHAAATLKILERSISEEMDTYPTLRNLMDAVNPVTTTKTTPQEQEHQQTTSTPSESNSTHYYSFPDAPPPPTQEAAAAAVVQPNTKLYGTNHPNNHNNGTSNNCTSPVNEDGFYYDRVTGTASASV